MALEQLDIYMQKKKKKGILDTDFTSVLKINSEWIINLKQKTLYLLEDNIGENLDDLGYDNAF